MKFGYRRYHVQLEHEKLHVVYRPAIPITIHAGGSRVERFALVDTGADLTVIPGEIASFLGIVPDRDKAIAMSGVEDAILSASPADVELELSRGRDVYRWRTRVYVADQQYVLLGTEGFLEYFVATFDWSAKTLEIMPSRGYEAVSTLL
jgi:predicted aspartyl protease